jgi:hypothetical protein
LDWIQKQNKNKTRLAANQSNQLNQGKFKAKCSQILNNVGSIIL